MAESEENKGRSDLLRLEEEIANFFEDLMYDRGGSPLLGRIYSLCVLSEETKSLFQKDLVDKFKVNPSTISRNLKELENWGLIMRRREPGSREWKYQFELQSFFELLVNKFEDNITSLKERGEDLKRIRDDLGYSLSKESKKTIEGKRALQILEFLIEWINIVGTNLEIFVKNLDSRFLELEKEYKEKKLVIANA